MNVEVEDSRDFVGMLGKLILEELRFIRRDMKEEVRRLGHELKLFYQSGQSSKSDGDDMVVYEDADLDDGLDADLDFVQPVEEVVENVKESPALVKCEIVCEDIFPHYESEDSLDESQQGQTKSYSDTSKFFAKSLDSMVNQARPGTQQFETGGQEPTTSISRRQPTKKNKNQCKLCKKFFTSKATLKRHARLHTGISKYQCKICNKAFGDRWNLRKHEKAHSNRKILQCKICNTTYVKSIAYEAHMRSHAGENPFKCDMCDKAYPMKSYLAAHMKSHEDEKRYKCSYCNKTFHDPRILKSHKKKQHHDIIMGDD